LLAYQTAVPLLGVEIVGEEPSPPSPHSRQTGEGEQETVDSVLQSAKCKVFGVVSPQWQHQNNFIPDIPEKFFTTLLAEAKSQAFVNLKQQVNAREERKAQKGRIRLQSESYKINDGEFRFNRKVNYGRR
jgi:hypothetical protein